MRSRMFLAVCAGALALPAALLSAPAGATGISFNAPIRLLGAGGGEPSIATDQKGNVYVSGPQGIPSYLGDQQPGVGFWASHDDASTFSQATRLGSYIGGGDSDVQVARDDGTVGILDLEAVASAVCFSHDRGASWVSASPIPDPGNCTTIPTGQAGPSADREWLTVDTGGRAYVSYHEFFSAQPLIFRTDNYGQDAFTAGPCGPIVTDPNIEVNVPQDITGGTLMSKPVLDKQGDIYILFTTTTQEQNVANLPGNVSGTFSQIYLAVSKDHCGSWTDYTVFDGSAMGTNSVQFGDIFNDITIDGAGNLYAIGAGYIDSTPPAAPTADIFLLSSSDGGAHWSAPRRVNTDVGAHMMPAAVGGPLGGQLAIGYYRTLNGKTNPNDGAAVWTYTVAESSNATSSTAGFQFADVQPAKVFHSGDICTSGILCGSKLPGTGKDRTLADFSSATIDAAGCPIFTFAGNPEGDANGTFNFVAKQAMGCFPTTAAVASPSPGGSVGGTTTTSGNSGGARAVTGLPNTASDAVGRGAAGLLACCGVGLAVGRRRSRRAGLAGR